MHPGSKKKKQQTYDAKEQALIERIWKEVTGENYRPEPKKDLEERVKAYMGSSDYELARHTLRETYNAYKHENNGRQLSAYFTGRDGHTYEIPKELSPLVVLLVQWQDYKVPVRDNGIYFDKKPARY